MDQLPASNLTQQAFCSLQTSGWRYGGMPLGLKPQKQS